MIIHYFDPSAWIKRHFEEVGSEAVNDLFRTTTIAACCRLGLIEMTATISRKSHAESLDRNVVDALYGNVNADFAVFRVVPVDEPRIVEATELTKRYRLRTMDAIHLACALSLGSETIMVSADEELLAAAAQEQISTINPVSKRR
jgi:predicted nucleic acid-binding protein